LVVLELEIVELLLLFAILCMLSIDVQLSFIDKEINFFLMT